MLCGRIDGATRECGEAQGYEPLPLRDEVRGGWPVMVTAWVPTPDELAALNAGASIHVCIIGKVPPPMRVEVGPQPEKS